MMTSAMLNNKGISLRLSRNQSWKSTHQYREGNSAKLLRYPSHLPSRHSQRALSLKETLELAIIVASTPSPGLAVGAAANTLVYIAGSKILLKGLTWPGLFSSWILGTLSYAAFGPKTYFIVCFYFIIGSLVTKLKLAQKQKEGIAEARSGRRGIGSVMGSGFAGVLCAIAALVTGDMEPWRIGFIASFASKLADTTSSEVGKAYGKTTYLISTLKRVPRGTEGAVSMEGTLGGVAAGGVVGVLGSVLGQLDGGRGVGCVIVAAFIANIVESWIGAVFQDKYGWLSNDVVNVLQICLSAIIAMCLSL